MSINKYFTIVISLFFFSCSFDNKSGIWKNENNPISDKDRQLAGFENLSITTRPFDQIINLRSNFKFQIDEKVNPLSWKDIFYNQQNNFDNFGSLCDKFLFISKDFSQYVFPNRVLRIILVSFCEAMV